jgi:protein O-GlcNAc transferase
MTPSSLFEKALTLALTEHEAGHFFNAEKLYRSALQLQPDHEQVNYHLGLLAFQKGFFGEAAEYFERVLGMNPQNPDYWIDLITALIKNDRLDEAENVIKIGKDHGLSGAELQKIEAFLRTEKEEVALFQTLSALFEACTHAKQAPFSETKKLHALLERSDFKKAKTLAAALIKKFPKDIISWQTLAAIYDKNGKLLWSMYISKQLLSVESDSAQLFYNYGVALRSINRLGEAESAFSEAISELKPDWIKYKKISHRDLLFLVNYLHIKTEKAVFDLYKNYSASFLNTKNKKIFTKRRFSETSEAPLKIAYASPDLRKHAVLHFIKPLLESHNQNQFKLFAYAELKNNKNAKKGKKGYTTTVGHLEDDESQAIKPYFAAWRNTYEMSDDEMAAQIEEDEIDILVDLAGHTVGNRLEVFARKPAPVSVTWLGYGYTTGLDAIDYFLCDSVMVPEGHESIFSEKPWRLPVPFCAYRPDERMGEVRGEIGRPGHIIFGSFSRSIRINDRVIAVWAAILQRVEGSRLLLNSVSFDSADIRKQIAGRFADFGIPASRLILGYTSPPYDLMKEVDIGLDCFPHNSGTTLMETLYMGIPFVTLADRPSVGRIGSSWLHGIGLAELIATSEQAYIQLAVALAKDEARLDALKRTLRPRLAQSPLMDEVGFTRHVEAAYRQMWQMYCEKPE